MSVVQLPLSLPPEHPDYHRERFDVKQAAAYLLLSPSSVYEQVAAGRLSCRRHRAQKRGGRLWFSQADLDAWRMAGRVNAASSPAPTMPRRQALAPLPMPKVRRFL